MSSLGRRSLFQKTMSQVEGAWMRWRRDVVRGTAPMGEPSGADVPRAWPVRTYLLLIVAVAVAAVTAATGYGFAWSSGQARDDATREMALQSQRAAQSISSAIVTGRKTVDALAAQPGLDKVFANPAGCQLSADGDGAFASVRLDLVSTQGKVACTSRPSPKLTASRVHAGSDWLPAALRGQGTAVDWTAVDAATGRAAVLITAPIRRGTRTVGAVSLFLHVPQVAPNLARTVAGIRHESFTIVDRTRHTVLSTSEAAPRAPDAVRFPDTRKNGDWAGADGSRRLFSSADAASTPWRVYAGERRSAVLADARGALSRQVLVGLLALLVLAASVWIINRRVAGPLRAVTQAVARARRAPDGARVDEAGPAELQALAREFNSMLDVRAGHNAQLVHQATHDPMTGLPNKLLLRDRLDGALRGDDAGDPDLGVAVLWIGIGRLDIVNDGFGHEVGDRISVEVSTRLSLALRSSDALARFSSHEYVVLCHGVTSAEVADVVERLQRSLRQPFRGPDGEIVLQSSIGIARARPSATSADQLLREADSAMREAKATGQGSYEFDGALQQRATRHLAVEREILHALQRDEFLVYYQPLVDVDTGQILGTEALVRWQHPERGLVPPMDFIPIAEETGQIAAIGRLVLTRACAQAAAWTAAGHPLRMSVNVAVDQLRDEDFPSAVAQVLAETGLAPDQLCLEITESSLVREFEQGAKALARLRDLGVHLAVDDFGTGYSSLAYLHDLPIDELKVDRSFIARLDRDSRDDRDQHMVEAVVDMARALGLSVVAEGVETDAQLEFLAGLHCPIAQGYLFAAPQPADGILALLQRQRDKALLGLAG
jgi:diguanylate cyclase (GGDEF)-like protein